jgi:hypothetical protein
LAERSATRQAAAPPRKAAAPPREQLSLSYPSSEQISLVTAHRLNGLLQSIIASVAILRMSGHESAPSERAAAEILERTKQIGGIVTSLVRDQR